MWDKRQEKQLKRPIPVQNRPHATSGLGAKRDGLIISHNPEFRAGNTPKASPRNFRVAKVSDGVHSAIVALSFYIREKYFSFGTLRGPRILRARFAALRTFR